VKGRLHYMSTDLDQLDMGWDVVSGCEWMLIQHARFQDYLRRTESDSKATESQDTI
jgi:hypothetical protein